MSTYGGSNGTRAIEEAVKAKGARIVGSFGWKGDIWPSQVCKNSSRVALMVQADRWPAWTSPGTGLPMVRCG